MDWSRWVGDHPGHDADFGAHQPVPQLAGKPQVPRQGTAHSSATVIARAG